MTKLTLFCVVLGQTCNSVNGNFVDTRIRVRSQWNTELETLKYRRLTYLVPLKRAQDLVHPLSSFSQFCFFLPHDWLDFDQTWSEWPVGIGLKQIWQALLFMNGCRSLEYILSEDFAPKPPLHVLSRSNTGVWLQTLRFMKISICALQIPPPQKKGKWK